MNTSVSTTVSTPRCLVTSARRYRVLYNDIHDAKAGVRICGNDIDLVAHQSANFLSSFADLEVNQYSVYLKKLSKPPVYISAFF